MIGYRDVSRSLREDRGRPVDGMVICSLVLPVAVDAAAK